MSAFLPIALAGMQATGSILEGVASSKAEQFNAAVSRANAQAIRQSADLDILRQRKAATRLKSAQIAGYAKAGVKLEGSPLEVLLDSASQAELDMMITDYNANIGIGQAESEAKQHEQASNVYLRKGIMQGASTLLSSGLGYGLGPVKPSYANLRGMGRVPVAPANYYKRGRI